MFFLQERDSGRIFHYIPADNHQRHGILVYPRPDPHHPPERDGLHPDPLRVLLVGQETRPRPVHPRLVSRGDGWVRPAHRHEDFVGPIRRGRTCHGWSRAVCRDAAVVGGRKLRRRTEASGRHWHDRWVWEFRRVSVWSALDFKRQTAGS